MVLLELGGVFATAAAFGALTSTGTSRKDERIVALRDAAARGQQEAITALVEGGLSVDASEEGETALSIAAAQGHVSTVDHLLSLGASTQLANRRDGTLAAHVAAAKDHALVLTQLLEMDAGAADVQDHRGLTPLHHACTHGHASATETLVVTFGASVDLHQQTATGCTPLALAVSAGSLACVRALLEHGGNTEAADDAGDTPLHRACASGHAQIAAALLEAGARMLVLNHRRLTPVDLANASLSAGRRGPLYVETDSLPGLFTMHHARRLAAGEHEANAAEAVRSRLLDTLHALRSSDPVALLELLEEAETQRVLARHAVDPNVVFGGAEGGAPISGVHSGGFSSTSKSSPDEEEEEDEEDSTPEARMVRQLHELRDALDEVKV